MFVERKQRDDEAEIVRIALVAVEVIVDLPALVCSIGAPEELIISP